jgi:hypothetical protein
MHGQSVDRVKGINKNTYTEYQVERPVHMTIYDVGEWAVAVEQTVPYIQHLRSLERRRPARL